jgi:hypothetical protein
LRFWTAPNQPGPHNLTVTAYDSGKLIARKRVQVKVLPPLGRTLDVEYEAPPEVRLGGTVGEAKTAVDELWRENPHTGPTCTKIVCQARSESCRITWASPPGNLGDAPGRDLSWASKVTFWARGHRGGERIRASVGAEEAGRFASTLPVTVALDPISGRGLLDLSTEWSPFTIPLHGNLSNLPVLFDVLVPPGTGGPVIFYLDDIAYVQ